MEMFYNNFEVLNMNLPHGLSNFIVSPQNTKNEMVTKITYLSAMH